MKKIIFTQRLEISKYNELRVQIDIRLIQFIIDSGYLPYPIPYFYPKKTSLKNMKKWLFKMKPDGLVLSGGPDIGLNKIRDITEEYLIKYSIKNKLPIYGICRGMQVLGKYFGVKLKPVKGHVNVNHNVYSDFKIKNVNSYHRNALQKCPKNFEVIYKSKGGSIESMVNDKNKIYACMWHPERNKIFDIEDISNFKKIFRK